MEHRAPESRPIVLRGLSHLGVSNSTSAKATNSAFHWQCWRTDTRWKRSHSWGALTAPPECPAISISCRFGVPVSRLSERRTLNRARVHAKTPARNSSSRDDGRSCFSTSRKTAFKGSPLGRGGKRLERIRTDVLLEEHATSLVLAGVAPLLRAYGRSPSEFNDDTLKKLNEVATHLAVDGVVLAAFRNEEQQIRRVAERFESQFENRPFQVIPLAPIRSSMSLLRGLWHRNAGACELGRVHTRRSAVSLSHVAERLTSARAAQCGHWSAHRKCRANSRGPYRRRKRLTGRSPNSRSVVLSFQTEPPRVRTLEISGGRWHRRPLSSGEDDAQSNARGCWPPIEEGERHLGAAV